MIFDELVGAARSVADAWVPRSNPPKLAQTRRDELPLEGGARLLHFRSEATIARPILLVPSLINRWYVLDLRPGASLVEALVGAGFDVWLLDWGVPEAEDRYLDWDSVLKRLGRAVRRVQRETKHASLGLLGYCMGGTLSAIYAAQFADGIAAFVTLCAPIDFSHGGALRRMVDPSWFDADAIANAQRPLGARTGSDVSGLSPPRRSRARDGDHGCVTPGDGLRRRPAGRG